MAYADALEALDALNVDAPEGLYMDALEASNASTAYADSHTHNPAFAGGGGGGQRDGQAV